MARAVIATALVVTACAPSVEPVTQPPAHFTRDTTAEAPRFTQFFRTHVHIRPRTLQEPPRAAYTPPQAPPPTHPPHSGIVGLIYSIFGSHGGEAVRVASCESGLDPYVRGGAGGNYWGLFQFGSFARAVYGFAWDALVQIKAAYRYFLDAGWGPWSCKP